MITNMTSMQYNLIMDRNEDVIKYDIACAKSMTENVVMESMNDKTLVTVLDVTEKYNKKIDDSLMLLSDVAVDSNAMTEMFTKIQNSDLLEEYPLATPMMSTEDIGKIKPEYLVQLAKGMSSVINDIINGKKTMHDIMNYLHESPFRKVKKQIVVTGPAYYADDLKLVFKNQPKAQIIPINTESVMSICVPFLRSFTVKKKELSDECVNVKQAIRQAVSSITNYTEVANNLKMQGKISPEYINTLNYYIYNMNRGLDELASYMVYMLITKINQYIFNINSLNELYMKIVGFGPEAEKIFHEGAFDHTVIATDTDSIVNRIIQGDSSALSDWANREWDYCRYIYTTNQGSNVGSTTLDFMLDKYKDSDYPYTDINTAIDKIKMSILMIPDKLSDDYASPSEILKSVGLSDRLLDRFSMVIHSIADIGKYEDKYDKGFSKSNILLEILAELRDAENNCKVFGEKVYNTHTAILHLIDWIENPADSAITNEVVKQDALNLITQLEQDYRNFLGVICENIVIRYKHLEEHCESLIGQMHENIDVPNITDDPISKSAMESVLEQMEIFNMMLMEFAMDEFHKAQEEYLLGTVFTEATPATNNATTDNSNSGAPTVTTNTSQMSQADKEKNAEAAAKASDADNTNSNSENADNTSDKKKSFKEKMSGIADSISKAIDTIVLKFKSFVAENLNPTAKNEVSATKFLEDYKEALLGRSYNGINLNQYPYNEIDSSTILKQITMLTNNVNAINVSNIAEYANEDTIKNKLFNFVKFPASGSIDEVLKKHYKVVSTGDNGSNIQKQTYSGSALRTLVAEMISFCEKFYGGEYNTVVQNIEQLKSGTATKMESFKELDTNGVAGSKKVSREVEMFGAVVLNSYKNKAYHYMYALKKLVPKTAKAPDTTETSDTTPEPETAPAG